MRFNASQTAITALHDNLSTQHNTAHNPSCKIIRNFTQVVSKLLLILKLRPKKDCMQIVTVELSSQNSYHLLQELEKLNILRIVSEQATESKTRLSDRFRNVFTREDAESFNLHTQAMRKEWDNT